MNPQITPTPDNNDQLPPSPQSPEVIESSNAAISPVIPVADNPNLQPALNPVQQPSSGDPVILSSPQVPPVMPIANPAAAFPYSQPSNPVNPVERASFKPRRLIFILSLVVLVVGISVAGGLALVNKNQKPFKASSAATPSNWVSFSNQAGNFSALFPTSPSVVPQSTHTAANGTSFTIDGFQSSNDTTAYLVTYITYPASVTFSSDTTTTLNNAVQGEVGGLQNGHLVSSSSTTISGHPAESYQVTGIKNGASYYLTGEVSLVGHVLYDVIAAQTKTAAPNAQYFLSNFKIGQ